MTRNLLTLLALTVVIAPVFGHHSETAEYDQTKPVKVTGTIIKVEWQNPHVWFYVDVKDDSGKITTWGFSDAPPGALMRRGITKDALKIGAVVNVEGSRARDGSNNASGRSVTFADGRNVFTATAKAHDEQPMAIVGRCLPPALVLASGATSRAQDVPRMPDGKPDFSGHLHRRRRR